MATVQDRDSHFTIGPLTGEKSKRLIAKSLPQLAGRLAEHSKAWRAELTALERFWRYDEQLSCSVRIRPLLTVGLPDYHASVADSPETLGAYFRVHCDHRYDDLTSAQFEWLAKHRRMFEQWAQNERGDLPASTPAEYQAGR